MFGPKIRNVFKSRWHALMWSASILLTAYCTVPSPNEKGDSDAEDVKAIAAMMGEGTQTAAPASAPSHHVNPWAKSSDQPAR